MISTSETTTTTPASFKHALPPSRLGTRHETLGSYNRQQRLRRRRKRNVGNGSSDHDDHDDDDRSPTEFSLVVILSRNARRCPRRPRAPHDDREDDEGDEDDDEDDEKKTEADGENGNDATGNADDDHHHHHHHHHDGISILLGKKLRGFGAGFHTTFGGKLERSRGEHLRPAAGAVRELREETGLRVDLATMEEGRVGVVEFTFDDEDDHRPMRVHVYCVYVSLTEDATLYDDDDDDGGGDGDARDVAGEEGAKGRLRTNSSSVATAVHPKQIRGCDEIEPEWFHDVRDIPLDRMFADDSLWLTMLLAHHDAAFRENALVPPPRLTFDAWYHFHPGGAETNSIMHHFLRITTDRDAADPSSSFSSSSSSSQIPPKEKPMSLERKLFHAIHVNHVHSPSIKEFKENWAMANAVRSHLKDDRAMERVVDVAGGHGALGALFLLLVPSCRSAVVIDPADCPGGRRGVRDAWSGFWSDGDGVEGGGGARKGKELRYRRECLRTGLRDELGSILRTTASANVTVVACHACQHLTDETMQIAAEHGVNVAVLPCCQKDHDGWWKGVAKSLGLSIGAVVDLLAAGKMLGWDAGRAAGVRYRVKVKLMKESISLQNRMILCRAVPRDEGEEDRKKEMAHAKLTQAYHRAHKVHRKKEQEASAKRSTPLSDVESPATSWYVPSLMTGFCMGAAFSFLITSQIRKNN